jgi:peptidoglycan/LPS O-acetylase OafA/YrhL
LVSQVTPKEPAMTTTPHTTRHIGRWGTAARLILAVLLLGSVIQQQSAHRSHPASWALGLLGFPAVLLAWQRLRIRRNPRQVHATGPVGHAVCLAIGAALALTPYYAPTLSITQPAIAIFYGASMLVAVARGYAGCEVLAVSNWLMRRDDQVGCVIFLPVDQLEQHRAR